MSHRSRELLIAGTLLLLMAGAAYAAIAKERLFDLYSAGYYDKVIAESSAQIAATPYPDWALLYLRGRSWYGIGCFDAADADLRLLGDWLPLPGWKSASEIVAKVAQVRRLAPAHMQEVRSGDRVLFRVYYDEDNAWVRALPTSLPGVYDKVCGTYGMWPTEIPVFVFADEARHGAFYRAWTGRDPFEWSKGHASRGAIILRDSDWPAVIPSDFPLPAQVLEKVRSELAHELGHLLMTRMIGTATVPTWLNEGLAQYCGSLARPQDVADNERKMLEITRTRPWLALNVVADRRQFYAADNYRVAYIQSFGMVRFLVSQVGADKVGQLLRVLGDESNPDSSTTAALGSAWFDLIFTKALGFSQQSFYDTWWAAPVLSAEVSAAPPR
jgi:hypothetical protein